ncbi:MAG: DUF1344 domain-containing protein [Candidatus Rokubacteria bacterium]|nr:DUF1344 domain-containing protein [Candidatus Rokubacteria bacterium]
MRSVLCGLGLAIVAGTAWAGEMTGTISSSEPTKYVLADGTEIWAPDGMRLPQLEEGTKVKVTYEERDGRKVVTGVEPLGN